MKSQKCAKRTTEKERAAALRIGGAVALVGAATSAALYWRIVRPWHLRWGATAAELAETLPGDEIVPHPRMASTHAITVHAPASQVWQWVAQIGQRKAGFYSYRWLENLVGCRMPDHRAIVPAFQHVAAGDQMWLHPRVPPLPVVRVETGQALVLGTNSADPGTWAFYLRPVDATTTRLIIRGRGEYRPSLLTWFTRYALFEPAHFVMEQKMMREIKARAEAAQLPPSVAECGSA